jgi:3-oxoacyl-[acyl-carrier-protein] synthase-3
MASAVGTLERIESFHPERAVDVAEVADRLGLSRARQRLFSKIHGLRTLRLDPDMGLFDLVLPAARAVLHAVADPAQVRYVIYAHTSQAVTPAELDAADVIRESLGLDRAEAFGLTQQNCAAGLGAIDIAVELLRADGGGDARALVVTGEKPFTPLAQLVPNIAIMGDAGAACLVAVGGAGHPVLSYACRTLGEYADVIALTEEQMQQFGQEYPRVLADVMRTAADRAGLDFDDIDLVIPHNVNMFSWRQITKEMDIPAERVFLDNVARFSHCFASDVLLNFTTLRQAGRLVEGRHYMLVSVGFGATFAAMVIRYHSPAGN